MSNYGCAYNTEIEDVIGIGSGTTWAHANIKRPVRQIFWEYADNIVKLCYCREIDRFRRSNRDALARALRRPTNFVVAGHFFRYLQTMILTQHQK